MVDTMIEEFIRKPLVDWNLGDLQALLGQAREDDRLEFKSEMYGPKDDPVKEMLKDVAALANHQGGYIVIGIEEDGEGSAVALAPVVPAARTPYDERIRASCRSNITPRINGIEVRSIPITPGGEAIVILIPFSYTRPHMITFKGLNQFWKRHGREKYPMTIDEIEFAFERRSSSASRMESFLARRRDKASRLSQDRPSIFLYACPISFPDEFINTSNERIKTILFTTPAVEAAYGGVRNHLGELRPSLDGLHAQDPDFGSERYLTVHRTGYVEYFASQGWYTTEEGRIVPFPSVLVGTVLDFCDVLAETYRRAECVVPMMVGLDIRSPDGLVLARREMMLRPIGVWAEPILEIPPRYTDDIQRESRSVTTQICDRLWNAFGHERCNYLNDAGELVDRG